MGFEGCEGRHRIINILLISILFFSFLFSFSLLFLSLSLTSHLGLYPLSYEIMVARSGGNPDVLPSENNRKKRALSQRTQTAPKLILEIENLLKYARINSGDPICTMQAISLITARFDTATKRIEAARQQPCEDPPGWVDQKEKRNLKHKVEDGVTSGKELEKAAQAAAAEKGKGKAGSGKCRCGSTSHKRTTHSECPLKNTTAGAVQHLARPVEADQTSDAVVASVESEVNAGAGNKKRGRGEEGGGGSNSWIYHFYPSKTCKSGH